MKQLILLLITLLLPQLLWATTSIDKPIKSMAFVNGSLMASPTLPVLFSPKKGQQKLSFRPAVFSADTGLQTHDGARFKAKFKGYGLSALYSLQLGDRLGLFLILMANRLTEGEFLGRGNDPSDPTQDVISTEVQSEFFQGGLGLSYQLINGKNLVVQLLGAPSFTQTKATQRITQEDPSDPDDFDMTLNPSTLGYIAGLQVGIRLFDNLAVIPYYMVSGIVGSSCAKYTMTTRQLGDQNGISDPKCQDPSAPGNQDPELEYDISFQTFGVNISLPEWGLGVNVFSELGEIQGVEGTDVQMTFVTLTFGG